MKNIMQSVRFLMMCMLLPSVVASQELKKNTASGIAPREFRGAWIATVTNLDWPSFRTLTPSAQRTELANLLDALASSGINAVVFQIRTECDALYPSVYDPWSYWLTGAQGTAPNPFYDPLEFAIAEAHRRGMELHAWFNPYRAYRQTNSYATHSTHVTQQHPDWVITCPDGYKLLNPGLPHVRDYVTNVVVDVLRRYNVDGIHFDDYFYPYPEHSFTNEDASTFAMYPRGFSSLSDWRRDNVNLLIRQIYDSIQVVKPWVKLGMSPFGIWKNGVPAGTSGMDAYSTIYCDAVAWLQGQYVDYLTPQLYWQFGGQQDYGTLASWWASQRNGRHLYPGIATYRIRQHGWPASEISSQIAFNRSSSDIQGSIQFRAKSITNNDGGIADVLRGTVNLYPAAPPVFAWKESEPPNSPQNVRASLDAGTQQYVLEWDPPTAAADGDSAARYLIYRFKTATPQAEDLQARHALIGLTGLTRFAPSARIDTAGASYTFAVASLDKLNNESSISGTASLPTGPISAPQLGLPADGGVIAKGGLLRWQKSEGALQYRVQLSLAPDFSSPASVVADAQRADTAYVTSGLGAETTYYWRAIAGGQGGSSTPSEIRSFTTGWPLPPTPVSPVSAFNVSRTPTLTWVKGPGTQFKVQIIASATNVVEVEATVSDSFYYCTKVLAASAIYAWRVQSSNTYGGSDWSTEAKFKTESGTVVVQEEPGIPEEMSLMSNFPNPFNAITRIRFGIAEGSPTTLRVYDLLGRLVATLVDGHLGAGLYEVPFEAGHLPSGPYLYVLVSGNDRMVKRMLLLK